MRGTTIELLWSHGIVCPLIRRSSRCTWGFYVAWTAGLHHKALFPHSTPERQSLFESHRQRRWLTHWRYTALTTGLTGMQCIISLPSFTSLGQRAFALVFRLCNRV